MDQYVNVDTVCYVNCLKSDISSIGPYVTMYVFMNISKRIDLAFINQGINDDAEEMICVCFTYTCFSHLWR